MEPVLAKFHNFGKIVKVLGNIFGVSLVLGNIENLPLHILHAIVPIFNFLNDQMLRN